MPQVSREQAPPLVAVAVMGVQGSGKSTIGAALAERIGAVFIDADDLHSKTAKAKMASGIPLNDADRDPWLDRVGHAAQEVLASGEPVVVACSALKRAYRDRLRTLVPALRFLHLTGSRELLEERLAGREHEYMPTELLESQLAALEPLGDDEVGVEARISDSPADIVERVAAVVGRSSSSDRP